MSIDATRWAWMQKGLRPLQKLILLSLADRAGADDCCYPSKAMLVEDTGVDPKSVWLCLKSLQEAGIISDSGKRAGHTGQITVWRLNGVVHRGSKDSENGSIPETEPFRFSLESIPKTERKAFQKRNPEPTKEPTRNQTPPNPPPEKPRAPAKPRAKSCFVLPPSVDPSAWAEFEAHRASIGKPLTDLAREKNAAVLIRLTVEQQHASIDATIANRWTGLFPPRNHAGNSYAANHESRGDRTARIGRELREHYIRRHGIPGADEMG